MKNELPWITNSVTPPKDKMLCLVLVNGKIFIDIVVWHKAERAFITHTAYQDAMVEVKLTMAEINGWLAIADIPLPGWAA